MSTPIPAPLREGFARFKADRFDNQQRVWRELADGQEPHTLVIGCCDSRVDPASIFDAGPGELFVVRNVANLVPPHESDGGHHGVSAALEFAVKTLGVKTVLVLGHESCGGVRAAATGGARDSEFIERWLDPLLPVCDEARSELGEDADVDALCDDVELRSVKRSLERLRAFPFIREAEETGRLSLAGARFGIASGRLDWLDEDGRFHPVKT